MPENDPNPPAAPESPDEVTKSDTIRITLPPKSEQPAVKRETVRINVPGKPVPPAPGVAPKKETSKLPTTDTAPAGGTPPPPPGAAGPKPFVPPPPGAKPMAPSAPGAPKPPSLGGGRPTVPLKPVMPEPVTVKGASPKKETARITLPPEGTKAPLPKATVKMQATQPLARGPAALAPAPSIHQAAPASFQSSGPEADPMMAPLGWALLVLSLAAAVISYLVYAAAGTA